MTKCANRLSVDGGCNYRENGLPGPHVKVFMFDPGGVEVLLDERRGNFYVVKKRKNLFTTEAQRHRSYYVKTNLLVDMTIADTQNAILKKQ